MDFRRAATSTRTAACCGRTKRDEGRVMMSLPTALLGRSGSFSCFFALFLRAWRVLYWKGGFSRIDGAKEEDRSVLF